MPRYISEYRLTAEGGTLTVPTCAKFLGLVKVSNYFVLIVEVWGNPSLVFDIDVKVFRKDEYILSDAKYLGYVLVGSDLYHFCYTEGVVEDFGGDGGSPDSVEESKPVPKLVVADKPAGGMREC